MERHEALVRLLGLPLTAVGMGYEYISQGELPEGIAEPDLRKVGSAAVPAPEAVPAAAMAPGPGVFEYIRDHKLMDMSKLPEVTIVPDEPLRAVLGVERMSFDELASAANRQLTPL